MMHRTGNATCLRFKIFPARAEESADLTFATCKSVMAGFYTWALRLYVDPMVYPYLSAYLPPLADLDLKQEVEPLSVHNSYSHPKLSTQYPYFDLCKFLLRCHIGSF